MGEVPAAKWVIIRTGCRDGLLSTVALENASECGFSAQVLLFR